MATKTTAPPEDEIQRTQRAELDALEALQAAQTEAATVRGHLDTLKARLLDGDDSVDGAQLGAAVHAVEAADLIVEAARLRVDAAIKAARLARLENVKAGILARVGDHDQIAAAIRKVAEGAAELLRLEVITDQALRADIKALQEEKVPLLQPGAKRRFDSDGNEIPIYREVSPEHAHLGWQLRDSSWTKNAVFVDDRTIKAKYYGFSISNALLIALREAGLHASSIDISLSGQPPEQLYDDLDAWVKQTY
ncbi:hypothetical protein ACIBP6_43125 [Nonomuraea terrae]|uniref:hypothetical protein n=1 Tax=Nonomuraea terrae TaxID=2530383 RepID=UPI0037B6164B